MELALDLKFGAGGSEAAHLGTGWSEAEEGHRWMLGESSDLILPDLGGADGFIELSMYPLVRSSEVRTQPLSLFIDDVLLGEVELSSPEWLAWRIPAGCWSGSGSTVLRLVHPTPQRPDYSGADDDRRLVIAVESARLWRSLPSAVRQPGTSSGTSEGHGEPVPVPSSMDAGDAGELVRQFESLGDSCEFGLVQRGCGEEPLGLLRFAYIHLSHLNRGIRNSFVGLGEPGHLRIDTDPTEYVVQDTRYGIRYHTFMDPQRVALSDVLKQQMARIKFLARKLMDDVEGGEKIFVIRRNETLRLEEILPLYCTLRCKAENTLLWVVPADSSNPPGTVVRIMPGLLQAFVTNLAAIRPILGDWLKICAIARYLVSQAPHLDRYPLHNGLSEEPVIELFPGRQGNASGYLGIGWPDGEPGFRWMVDTVSEVWFDHPGSGFDHLIELDATPYCRDPDLRRQRLSVEVRGAEIATEVLCAPSRLRWRVPSHLLDAPGPIRVTFHHPDATRPTDFGDSTDERMLALAVRSLQLIRLRPDPPGGVTMQSPALLVAPRSLASPPGQHVVFVGNCQMEVLARLYKAACVRDERMQVSYVASYEEATEAQLQVISQAGVLIQQVLDFAPVVGDLRSGGRVVQVPHFTAAFLWPFTGQAHPQNRPEPTLDDSGPYPAELGDSFLNRMIINGVAAEDAVSEYLAADVPVLKRLDRLAELFLEKQHARDRACGFSCADYIEANFRTRPLFLTPNHPEDQAARWFAAEVFGRIEDNDVSAQIAATSIPLFSPSEMPIHPLVGAHFSLSYTEATHRYRYYNEGSFTFEEWAGRYMRYDWNAELARGLHLLKMGMTEEAIGALLQAMPTAPRAAGARVVLADALERLDRLEEAVEFAYEAVAIEPQNPRYLQRLLEISDRKRAQRC